MFIVTMSLFVCCRVFTHTCLVDLGCDPPHLALKGGVRSSQTPAVMFDFTLIRSLDIYLTCSYLALRPICQLVH